MMVPPENSRQPIAEVLSSIPNRRLNRLAALPESDERNSLMCTTQRDSLGANLSKAQGDAARGAMGFGFFRQPVFRSGGAAHRLAAPTQPTPFLAAESLVAPASPSPTKDACWSGDNTRNTNGGFFVASSQCPGMPVMGGPQHRFRSIAVIFRSVRNSAALSYRSLRSFSIAFSIIRCSSEGTALFSRTASV